MSRLIETIRVANGKLANIGSHFKRMSHVHDNAILELTLPAEGVHKLRIVYDPTSFSFEISPYTIKPIRSLKLVFDNTIVYDQKFEDRSAINKLVDLKQDCDDVLIIKNSLVTDVSYANIIFKKSSTWYTPDSFLLNGTMRQNLLDSGKIKERRIMVNDLREFSHFKLINAMLLDEAPESEVLNIR